MVNLASDINKDLVISDKAEFRLGDASSLPWKNNEFSVVVGILTFFFWNESLISLKEIYRINNPPHEVVVKVVDKEDIRKEKHLLK